MIRVAVLSAILLGSAPGDAAAFMDLYNFREKQAEPPAVAHEARSVAMPQAAPAGRGIGVLIPALGEPLREQAEPSAFAQIPALGATVPIGGFGAARGAGLAGPDEAVCIAAIMEAERRHGIPENLLLAIGLQEAGRQIGGQLTIWPWSVNSRGQSHMFDTGGEAAAFAASERAAGHHLVDVGCMQVNLHWHPGAFASIETGFDPARNADYAAGFLARLHQESGDWMVAAGNYHSRTARHHRRYLEGIERNLAVASARAEHFAGLAGRAGPAHHLAKTNIAERSQMGQDLGRMMAQRGGFSRRAEAIAVTPRARQPLPSHVAFPPERLEGAWWSAAGSGADRARSIYSSEVLEPVLPVLAANGPRAGG